MDPQSDNIGQAFASLDQAESWAKPGVPEDLRSQVPVLIGRRWCTR